MPPVQVIPRIKLQTTRLQPPQSKYILPNPASGSVQNQLEAIKFYFPRIAAQAASLIIATNLPYSLNGDSGFSDVPDSHNFDLTKAHGTLLNNMPSFGAIEFGNTDKQNKSGNQYTGIDGRVYTFPNILLPIAIINVSQPTNIVKTKITGRPGSVKQYIGSDDKQVTINAVVNMANDQAPITFLNELQQMKDAAVTIPVINYFLNALDIYYLLIEDISTPQQEGEYSNQTVTITACSDIPLSEFLP